MGNGLSVCVRVRVFASPHACMYAWVHVCIYAWMRACEYEATAWGLHLRMRGCECVHVCLSNPAWLHAYAWLAWLYACVLLDERVGACVRLCVRL